MDRDQKLSMFLSSLGDGIDVETAQSILESNDWDVQAALSVILGDNVGGTSAQPTPQVVDAGGYREPMRTGYNDTLMGPSNPFEERRMQAEADERNRKREEELRAQAEAQRLAAENARHESLAQQVEQQRANSERLARERRVAKLREQQEEQRRAAAEEEAAAPSRAPDVEARIAQPQADEPMQQAREEDTAASAAEAAQRLQRASEEETRRRRKESEELQREKAEAEARRIELESAPVKQKEVDPFVHALVALRKKYKDIDAAGLVMCLSTLRAYINNLCRNPQEAKFQRINYDNNAFRTRIAAYEGASSVLVACGFIEEQGAMVVGPDFLKTKGSRLWDALSKLDVMLEQVKAAVGT